MKIDYIKAHTSFLGKTGYNNHSRNFFTHLNRKIPTFIRNYSMDGCNLFYGEDGGKSVVIDNNGKMKIDWSKADDYITEEHKKMLYYQTVIGDNKDYSFHNQFYKNISGNSINIILNEVHHHFFYQDYNSYKIGYYVWETTKLPHEFFKRLFYFDEIWVVSQWQKECLIKQGYNKPIYVIPEGIDNIFQPIQKKKSNKIKFLIVGRWDYRKSTKEIIETFLKVFKDNNNVELILNVDNNYTPKDIPKSTIDKLKFYNLTDNRIKIKSFLSRKEYIKLIQESDIFLSCARGEGWNLPLIEAMGCGIPSIYSECSGQLEFAKNKGIPIKILQEVSSESAKLQSFNYDNLTGNFYEPDFDDLGEKIKMVYNNFDYYKQQALIDSKIIRKEFSWENAAEKAFNRIQVIENIMINKKKKILFITPHLSTGGLPQVMLKQIELIKDNLDVYVIEYTNVTGGKYIVQRDKIINIVSNDKFYSLAGNNEELKKIILLINPNIIHFEEIPEMFLSSDIINWIYNKNRNYKIIETTHSVDFDINNKKVLPDKFNFVSYFSALKYINFNIPYEVIEYPVNVKKRNKIEAQKKLGFDPLFKHIICVGLFTPNKNQKYLFDIADYFKNEKVIFHFIGNQAINFQYYWKPLMNIPHTNCIIHGERSDIDLFYEACDLFAFPSTLELNPIVVKEALEWNIPIIMFNLPIYLGKYDNEKNINIFSNNVQADVEKIQFILDKQQSFNYNGVFDFDCSYDINKNTIFITYKGEYPKHLSMSIKDIDSHIPIHSITNLRLNNNDKWWIVPIGNSTFQYDKRFHGFLLEWYDPITMELLLSKELKIRDGFPINDVVFKTQPMDAAFINYVEFFYTRIYDNIDIRNSDVVFDIGANIGVFTSYALSQNVKKIYSFEPIKCAYNGLQDTFKNDDRVVPINKAIDIKSGKRNIFTIKNKSTISSFYNKQKDNENIFYEEEIETITLDDFIEKNNIKKIDLFKIDVEGAEYEILNKMDNKIWNIIDKMIIEFHMNTNGEIYKIIDKLKQYGFIYKVKKQIVNEEGSINDTGGVLLVEKEKLPKKCFISMCTENYLGLAKKLVESLNLFSKYSIVLYGINCDINFDYPNLISRKILSNNIIPDFITKKSIMHDKENIIFNDDSIGYIDRTSKNTFLTLQNKINILLKSIDDDISEAIFLDCDMIANDNVDELFNYFKDIENYPLIAKSVHEHMILNERGNVYKNGEYDETLSLEYPLMKELNVNKRSMKYVNGGILLYNQDCKLFFKECLSIITNKKFLDKYDLYFPFHIETLMNVLLWKYNATKHLPVVHFNLINYEWLLKFFNEQKTNYRYDTGWQYIPENKNDIKFFHGCKSIIDLDKCISYLENKTINKKYMVIKQNFPNLILDEHLDEIKIAFKQCKKEYNDDDTKQKLLNFYNTINTINMKNSIEMPKFNINYIDGAFCEVECFNDEKFKVEFIDDDTNDIIYDIELSNKTWAKTSRKYFTNWRINIKENNKLIKSIKLNLENKKVYIAFESKSLGDNIAWIPYVEEFRKKHNCKIIVSTFWNDLFKEVYSELEFVNPGIEVLDIVAMYKIGCFDPWGENFDMHPNDFRKIPLQKIAADILGLEYKEIKPNIDIVMTERKIKNKYICISEFSTAQAKYWNNPNGWQEIVDYLNSIGIKTIVLGIGKNKLKNVIDMTGELPIQTMISYIYNAEFSIGISSGLVWLAWALGKKVILISGFTRPFNEFLCHRVYNSTVCRGCYNSNNVFDKSRWDWCPIHQDTDRQFECTKTISSQMVIDEINNIMKDDNNDYFYCIDKNSIVKLNLKTLTDNWKWSNYSIDDPSGICIYHEVYKEKCYSAYDKINFKVEQDDIVVDLGANIGIFTKYALENGAKAVYAFEPEDINFKCLEQNVVKYNNVNLYKKAVSNINGKRKLFLDKTSGGHSLFFNDINNTKLNKHEEIDCITIQSLFDENILDKIDFLKIDVEGAEVDILNSISDDIYKKIKKITIEYHHMLFDFDESIKHNLIQKLKNLEYNSFEFYLTKHVQMLYFWRK